MSLPLQGPLGKEKTDQVFGQCREFVPAKKSFWSTADLSGVPEEGFVVDHGSFGAVRVQS